MVYTFNAIAYINHTHSLWVLNYCAFTVLETRTTGSFEHYCFLRCDAVYFEGYAHIPALRRNLRPHLHGWSISRLLLLCYIEDIYGKFLRNVAYLPNCEAINPKDNYQHIHRRQNLAFLTFGLQKYEQQPCWFLKLKYNAWCWVRRFVTENWRW